MCGEVFSRIPNPQLPKADAASDGHDASRLAHDDLVAFVNAYLNNRPGQLETLRKRLAVESLPPASAPDRLADYPAIPTTRDAAAAAIVAFLTDYSGEHGNSGDFLELEDAEEEEYSLTFSNDSSASPSNASDLFYLWKLIQVWQAAAA